MSQNYTIAKRNVYAPLYSDTLSVLLYKLIYEFFDNHKYNSSSKCFIDVDEEDYDDDDETCINVYYGYDCSINKEENCDRLLKLYNTNTDEIAHKGNGFKRFSYKHNGIVQVFSRIHAKKYIYIEQNQKEIYEASQKIENDIEFSSLMDSKYTTFATIKRIRDAPSWYTKYYDNFELDFKPNTLIKFTIKKSDFKCNEYVNPTLFKEFITALEFKNNKELDVYVRNKLIKSEYNEFKQLKKIDHLCLDDNFANLKNFMDVEVYAHETDPTKNYCKIINNKDNIEDIINKPFSIEFERDSSKEGVIKKFNGNDRDHYKNITFRFETVSVEHQANIKKILKITRVENAVFGTYLRFNGHTVDYKPLTDSNTYLNPAKNSGAGCSRKRVIFNLNNNANDVISVNGIKTESRINSAAFNSNIGNIIKKLNNIYNNLYDGKVTKFDDILNMGKRKKNKPKTPKPDIGFIYSVKLGKFIFKLGYTKDTNPYKYIKKQYHSGFKKYIDDKKLQSKAFKDASQVRPIFTTMVKNPTHCESLLKTLVKKYYTFTDREEYFDLSKFNNNQEDYDDEEQNEMSSIESASLIEHRDPSSVPRHNMKYDIFDLQREYFDIIREYQIL